MAKKLYVPVNGLSKEIKKFYVSVNGVSKKVTKAYVSVNGLSKLFFVSGGGGAPQFWLFYSTIIEKIIDGKEYTVVPIQIPVEIRKRKTGIAFYFFIQQIEEGNILENLVITVSTDSTATPYNAICNGQTEPYTTVNSTTVNNQTWYYTVGAPMDYDYKPQYPADISPNCIVSDSDIEELYDVEDMVKGFLNRYVYTNDFAEDYQVGQTYSLYIGDKEKTIRKCIALGLFINATNKESSYYRDGYYYWLNHKEEIIQEILSRLANYNVFTMDMGFQSGSGTRLLQVWAANITTPYPITITYEQMQSGYKFLYFENSNRSGIPVSKIFRATLDLYGNLTWSDIPAANVLNNIGAFAMSGSSQLSNAGLKFIP